MRRQPIGLTRRAQAVAAAALACVCLAAADTSHRTAPPQSAPAVTPAPLGSDASQPPGEPDATQATGPPTPTPAAFGAVIWRELHYSAHKFIFGASTTLSVQPVSADALATLVQRPPKASPVALPAGDTVAVSMATDLPFGRNEQVILWLDPATGAALGGEKTTLGHSPYRKIFRFTEGGLYTWRSAPKDSREANQAPEAWTRRKQYVVSPAVKPPPGTPVTDSYGLLYLVSAARLDRKESSLRLVMLADEGYIELVFTAGGLSYRRADLEESWAGGTRHRDGRVLVRTVRATGHALDNPEARQDVDLGFLGMRGALTLDVEVGTGIPIAFAGRVEHIGDVVVRLDRVVLAGTPPAESDPIP